VAGDFTIDQTGHVWICTIGGSPGTWASWLNRNATAGTIAALGTQAAGSSFTLADAAHVHPTTGLMTKVADTGNSGYTLVNGTGTILSWTAPNDGALHRAVLVATLEVTSAETGGQIIFQVTSLPGGHTPNFAPFGGSAGAGGYVFSESGFAVPAGQTVALKQNTALTPGAAVLYAQIWAS
jgi:hypothetical protein